VKVVIFGGSGLIGKAIKDHFESVKIAVRDLSKLKEGTFYWNPITGDLNPKELEGIDAIINLSGDSIVQLRWTEQKKRELYESRIRSTALIVNTIQQMSTPPKYLFNASGAGYYGNCCEEVVTEETAPGRGFLATMAQKWEAAACNAEGKCRVVLMRSGLILSKEGGLLKKMLIPFQLCLGGKLGSGQQWMSWLAIDDIAPIIHHLYENNLAGPVNFVSPNPVRNEEFTKVLAEVLNRPALLNLSEANLRLLLGEIADEMILSSAKVIPKVLLDSGYKFKYPFLKEALIAQTS
jgi:uncharacterized protein (TIGR01777 family)